MLVYQTFFFEFKFILDSSDLLSSLPHPFPFPFFIAILLIIFINSNETSL